MNTLKSLLISILFLLSHSSYAQNETLKGKILDNFNHPIPFAHVEVVNSNVKAACNKNGVFSISNVAFPLRITISAVGFTTSNQLIKTQNNDLIIVLKDDNELLDQIVISGSLDEVVKRESPISVEVYSSKFLKKIPVPSLMEASSQISGLRPQLNCAVCNTGDIHMNGMEGAYSMVVMDGMPIVGGLSTVYGIQGIPVSLIQRLEVVKGPASTLYGSEAMAGLINVITKSVSCIPDFSMNLNLSSWNDYKLIFYLKVLILKKLKLSLQLMFIITTTLLITMTIILRI